MSETEFEDTEMAEDEVTVTEKPKAKKKAKKAKPAKETAGLDAFGLRISSVRSQAAALYAREEGATLNEVKEKVGTIQFNVLTRLQKQGFVVDTTKEAGKNNRTVTRYFLNVK